VSRLSLLEPGGEAAKTEGDILKSEKIKTTVNQMQSLKGEGKKKLW